MPNNPEQGPKAMHDDHVKAAWQSAFFNRLLDRVDPHDLSINAEAQHAQVSCGRWLALQRLQLGLTTEELARQVGADPQSIFLLEAGLGDPQLLSNDAVSQLQKALANGQDHGWVERVMALALGQLPLSSDPSIIEQVQAQLDQAYSDESPISLDESRVSPTVAPQPVQQPIDLDAWLPLSADLFAMLGVLQKEERHLLSILQEINARDTWGDLRIGAASVSAGIARLEQAGFVEMVGERRDADGQSRRYYRLTMNGRRVFYEDYQRRDVNDTFRRFFPRALQTG